MKLIIAAMEVEVELVIKKLNLQKIDNSIYQEFISNDRSIVLIISNIGLVNAASSLTYAITKYKHFEYILNIGTAASVSPYLKQGELVAIQNAYYGFADATIFGYQYGQIPRMPKHYYSNIDLITKSKLKMVNLLSSDVFVNEKEKIIDIVAMFDDEIHIMEMEATSLMQVAYLFANIPIIVVKIISDSILTSNSSALEFNDFMPIAQEKIRDFVDEFINK